MWHDKNTQPDNQKLHTLRIMKWEWEGFKLFLKVFSTSI